MMTWIDPATGMASSAPKMPATSVPIGVATIGIDLICAPLALGFKHGAKQTEISNFGGAILWTSTQLLTVSSSITTRSRRPDGSLTSPWRPMRSRSSPSLAGSIGAFVVKRGRELEAAAEKTQRA
jgi:hypothetical protein